MNDHIAKKQSTAAARFAHECKMCYKDLHSFYKLREHKRKEHGGQRGSRAQNVDVAHVKGDVDDNYLKEEMERSKQFLVDREMRIERRRVYNFAMDTLETKYLLEKLDVVIDNLKRAG